MSASRRLTEVMKKSAELVFDDSSRIVIMSDCHRGDGGWSDNFSGNQNLFFAALTYYYDRGYTYIELGDGDELWENRKIETIILTHSNCFWLMSLFYREGRFYMLYGNHDIIKKDPRYSRNKCSSFFCDSLNKEITLFPGIEIPEGILLTYRHTGDRILLTHGHQADILNDTLWPLSRFLVRYLWRPLEIIGINDPTSAAKNVDRKNKVEKRLAAFARDKKQMLITGHTHRPIFPKVGEAPYFNDGSCIHPRCITALEITNGAISLVKWATLTRADRSLYVGRVTLEAPVRLTDYFNELSK
jgi:predicted phosphodiesterase